MAPGIERCFDGPEAIIGCGHSLDVVAKDMVCRLGTDCGIRIASPPVWERAVGVVVLGDVFNPPARTRPSVACALAV